MDVTANIPSGTYHAPIYITLTPSEPLAKTFYSFKPDGTPNDAFLYTGSILLKHSTPFIYFSFLTTDNESKIKQNDYIFEYPSSIRFGADTVSGSGRLDVAIVNQGTESVDIGWWYVQSEIDSVTIPEGTILAPGAQYSLGIRYTGTSAIALRSPDDEEKDILTPESYKGTETSPPKSVTTKVVPRKIISTRDTPVTTPTPISPIGTPAPVSPSAPENTSSSAASVTGTTIHSPSPELDLNQIAKVSATESGSRNLNPLYLVGLLILSFGAGGIQWYIRKKQK